MIGLQQQTFQTMASTIKQGFSLPKPDISKFDGNPLDYWNFVRSFDNGISKNASDDGERLSYLLQYCTGAAKDAIKSCLALDSAVGYRTARTLLEERFGHPYKIAAAHFNRITRGAPLKRYDQRGLLTFADQLRDCQNVLDSIGYMDEINSADNFSTQSHAIGAGAKYHGSRNQPTSTRICLRIVPVRVHDNNSGRTLETYTLLDNGSDVSLCDAELVKELDLQGERRDFLLTTQEKKDRAKSGLELKLTISSLDGTSALEIQMVWTVDRLNVLSRSIPRAEDVQG